MITRGVGIDVSTIGDLFHITKTAISVGNDIPNSWVMFHWDVCQPLLWIIHMMVYSEESHYSG